MSINNVEDGILKQKERWNVVRKVEHGRRNNKWNNKEISNKNKKDNVKLTMQGR